MNDYGPYAHLPRRTCGRCTMSFAIGKSDHEAERLRCPECGIGFWAGKSDRRPVIHCGILPADLRSWLI